MTKIIRLQFKRRPSGDEEESEAKRPRSASTTPKSARAREPDEYDRLMGISSIDLSDERDGFRGWGID